MPSTSISKIEHKSKPKRSRGRRHAGFNAAANGQLLCGRHLAEYIFGKFPTDRDYELARRRLYRQARRFGLFKMGDLWCGRKDTVERALAELERAGTGAAEASEPRAAADLIGAVAEQVTAAVLAELASKRQLAAPAPLGVRGAA